LHGQRDAGEEAEGEGFLGPQYLRGTPVGRGVRRGPTVREAVIPIRAAGSSPNPRGLFCGASSAHDAHNARRDLQRLTHRVEKGYWTAKRGRLMLVDMSGPLSERGAKKIIGRLRTARVPRRFSMCNP